MPDKDQQRLLAGLGALDQVPLKPPSVGGWPAGAAWLTTSSAQARLRMADELAALAEPGVLDGLTRAGAGDRPDALARLLVVDGWTDRTRAVLASAASQLRRLIALGLASPEYTVH
jgi:uncharacterized protein (DUF1800 family)